MRHRVVIMRDKGEPAGGGELPQEEREETLEAAATLIASVAPRFFKLVKARMLRDLDIPDDIRELGESQIWALHALAKGRHQVSELARHYNVTDPTMSRIVDALVRKGYVARRPDLEDRRCIFLEITEQGTYLAGHVNEHLHKAIVRFLSPLSEEQLNDIVKAYRHLGSLLPDASQELERELRQMEATEEGTTRRRGRGHGPWRHARENPREHARERDLRNPRMGHGWRS
jgi:DNA-binding MarR family transcriptional regulator